MFNIINHLRLTKFNHDEMLPYILHNNSFKRKGGRKKIGILTVEKKEETGTLKLSWWECKMTEQLEITIC